MRTRLRRRPSAATIISLVALFASIGGVGYAATGGNFILGQANTATARSSLSASVSNQALRVTNTNTGTGATALGLNVATGHSPLTVNSSTKVANLNADQVDGLDSTAFLPATGKAADADKLDGLNSTNFLQNSVPLSLTGSTAGNAVIAGTNTGSGNGLQGVTASVSSSGVYGENDGGGFGLAGRSNQPGGVGVYAESLGGGVGVAIHTSVAAPPLSVDSSAKVANLNSDMVDGASILSNRIISTTQNDHIIQLPGFGDFNVVSCDHTNAVFQWSSGGPQAFVFWWDELNTSDGFEGVANLVTSNPRPHHFVTVQLARDVGSNTSMATVTLTTQGSSCVFAAQAIVQTG